MSETTAKLGITTWDGTDSVSRQSFNDNWNKIDTMVQKNITQGAAAPANPVASDLWIDDSGTPNLLKRYDGTEWAIVGYVISAATNTQLGGILSKGDISVGVDGTPTVLKVNGADVKARTDNYNATNSSPDVNGRYTVTTYKRSDNTTYMVSTMSGTADSFGNYPTMTNVFYKTDGTTVDHTDTWTLTFDSNGIKSGQSVVRS